MKLTQIETANFCRNLALLLHAGISVADSVFLLAQEETGRLRELLQSIGAQMDAGETLSAAMEKSGAFAGCVTGMVHTGEQTGSLEEVLEAMARYYEQRSRSSRQIKNALTYPAFVLALMLLVVGVLLVKVMPVFEAVYASLGGRLTGVAAALLQAGSLLEAALPALFGILAVVILAALLYAYCSPVRNKVNTWWMTRFGDRGISRAYNNANFARALAMGLASGMPLEDAVELSGKLLSDIPGAAQRCSDCAGQLRGGSTLAEAMDKTAFLPPAESRMLAVGLRQGSGDKVMADIADRLMERSNEDLENMVAKIEPALVLSASILVGVILLSVMLPLMNIMSAIG